MTHVHQAINPHAAQPTSVLALAKSMLRNRQLILQMTKRAVVGRYKGSIFGLGANTLVPSRLCVVSKTRKGFADVL